MNNQPDEMLCLVFSHLNERDKIYSMKVCKRWNLIYKDIKFKERLEFWNVCRAWTERGILKAFLEACEKGSLFSIKYIAQKMTDLRHGTGILHHDAWIQGLKIAVKYNRPEVVRLMSKYGACNNNSDDVLQTIAKTDNIGILKVILEEYTFTNDRLYQAITTAEKANHINVASFLQTKLQLE